MSAGICTGSTCMPTTQPHLMSTVESTLQKAMCTNVRDIGYGNPAYDSTHLLYSITVEDSVIHKSMSKYDQHIALLTDFPDSDMAAVKKPNGIRTPSSVRESRSTHSAAQQRVSGECQVIVSAEDICHAMWTNSESRSPHCARAALTTLMIDVTREQCLNCFQSLKRDMALHMHVIARRLSA
jgi:hypothetical protein